MALNLANLAALISKRTRLPAQENLGENEYCCEVCGGFFEAPEFASLCPECEAATR